MPRKSGARDEILRESRAAAAEVRIELREAERETREALREAMDEIRAAFSEALSTGASDETARGSGRMSRAQRKEATRELLLDAAIEVFAAQGYHGASLDDVAEAAGFTKGAVYSNFSRKSDLFRALLERETKRTNAAVRQAIAAVPLKLLPDIAAELLRRTDPGQVGDSLVVEFWLAAVRDPSLRPMLLSTADELGEVLDEKLIASGRRPGIDGRELAVIADALAMGLSMNRSLDPDGDQPLLFTKALRKLIMDLPPREADDEDDA